MENVTIVTLSFFVCFYLVQRLIVADRHEQLVILLVLVMIVHIVYKQTLESNGLQHSTKQLVNNLDKVSREQFAIEEDNVDKSENIDLRVQTLMSSDALLQSAMRDFIKYKEVDLHLYRNVMALIFKYYHLYVDCLMGSKNAETFMLTLIEYRRSLLNHVASLNIMVSTKQSEEVYRIMLRLQACTYKCLNVLKNKFGVSDYVSPIPHNLAGNDNQLF